MPQSIGKALFLTPPLCCGGHHCRILGKRDFFSWPFLGFHIYFKIPIVSLTQKNGRSPWLAPFCCFVRDISWRKLSAHGAAGVPVAWLGQRDRHHVRPRDRPTRDSRGPHHPAQGPQGRPPARGQALSPHPGPNHLREGGLPPGIGHALPDPLDPAPLATHGDRALGLGHPDRPHTGRSGPGHATKPPPQTAAIPHLRVPRHPQGPQPRGS